MSISVLYVCNEDLATTKQRLQALEDLGIATDVVYTSRLSDEVSFFKRVERAIKFRAGFFPERNDENRQLLQRARTKEYDVVFVEKGLSIRPSTLLEVKRLQPDASLISYTLDDVMNRNNSSRYYLKGIPIYDMHFTNKSYNVEELRKMGARNVKYFRNAFSLHVHRPVVVSANELLEYGADVAFIGTYEEERVQYLRFLAENGIPVKLWGWGKTAAESGLVHPNIFFTDRYVYDDEYTKVVCSSKINLCFLRKVNRDTETTRSIEIPACGGFMLAERTPEHLSLFREGVEAAYFESKQELLEKVKRYLSDNKARRAIANNGLLRCRTQDYSYHKQLQTILNQALGYEAIGDSKYAPDTV